MTITSRLSAVRDELIEQSLCDPDNGECMIATGAGNLSEWLCAIEDATQALSQALEQNGRLSGLLARAEEELYLIRSKDCDAVYDVTLRSDLRAALEQKP